MLFVAAYRLPGGLAAILTSTQTLMVLLLVWLVGNNMPPKTAWLSAANIGGYAYLCLFGAVLAYVLFFRGVARLSPAVVTSLGLLSPVCAFVLGWLFLGQSMDAKAILGFVLTLASIYGVQRAMAG